MKIKILIFDTVHVISIALKSIIITKFPKYEIEIASDCENLMELVNKNNYDILIIDIFNSETINISYLKELKKKNPFMKNILFTENNNDIILNKCFKNGIDVYLNKNCDEQKITKALHLLIEEKKHFTKSIKIKPQQDTKNYKQIKKNKGQSKLSSREIQIATLLLKGKSVTYISSILNITNSTVSTFKKRIFLKTKTSNIIELDSFFKKNDLTT